VTPLVTQIVTPGITPEPGTPTTPVIAPPTDTGTTTTSDSLITPDPAECTATPRTAEALAALSTSPDQAALDALAATILRPGLEVPAGTPAEEATTAAVTETYRQMTACFNAGNDLAAYALWTDNAVRQMHIAAPAGAPEPLPEGERLAFQVLEVRVLPDDRVVAVWAERDPESTSTAVQLLVQQGDRYLIDETVDVIIRTVSDSADVPLPATPFISPSTPTPPTPTPTPIPPETALAPVACDVTFVGPLIFAGSGVYEGFDRDGGVVITDAATRDGAVRPIADDTLTLSFSDSPLQGEGSSEPDVWFCGVAEGSVPLTVEGSVDGDRWIDFGMLPAGDSGIDLDAFGFGPDMAMPFLRLSFAPERGTTDQTTPEVPLTPPTPDAAAAAQATMTS
jgi:hypothetical protein